MKPFLALVGGFVMSMGMFAGGIALSAYMLAVDTVESRPGPSSDVADLWTDEPRRVTGDSAGLERVAAAVPATGASQQETTTHGSVAGAETDIDTMATGALDNSRNEEQRQQVLVDELMTAHLEWCAARYRSFRPETNTYTSYNRGTRACESPYLEELLAAESDLMSGETAAADLAEPTMVASAEGDTLGLTSEHVRDCFNRYRSYRPEDNSYQPYGGGPRRQCQ